MRNQSEYAPSVTSQFYFCSLPLRLDTYSQCGFKCAYCFALARGGNHPRIQHVVDAKSLDRRLNRVLEGRIGSAVDEFLAHGQPIHLGGMSDPFPPVERTLRITLETLKVLADYSYPTIISTKGDLFGEDAYLDVLRRGRFMLQLSLSSLDEQLLKRLDLGTPSPSRRLQALRVASDASIPTSVRIQPVLPGRERDAEEVLGAAASAGAFHVGVEHLKLPVEESWRGRPSLTYALGEDAVSEFAVRGHRMGREWILPLEDRLPLLLRLREQAAQEGISFGAADNDLLWLSCGTCCCSGADVVPGFSGHLRCNYTEAVRRGWESGEIEIGLIRDAWSPQRTLARFVNSHSRLPARDGQGAGLWAYVEASWNGSPNGNSPGMFFGIQDTGERDAGGFAIYAVSEEARQIAGS